MPTASMSFCFRRVRNVFDDNVIRVHGSKRGHEACHLGRLDGLAGLVLVVGYVPYGLSLFITALGLV